jgi:uncharacterized protein DUF1559
MNRKRMLWNRPVAILSVVSLAIGLTAIAIPATTPAAPASDGEPSDDLAYVPVDAALFVRADVAAIWNHPIVQAIRKADAKFIADLTGRGKSLFGLSLDDVRSVTLFAPSLKQPDHERVGMVVTFRKAFDREKIESGIKKVLPDASRTEMRVIAVNNRTALVLLNLGDGYAKPQPAATGPLTAALKEAATGKHALVAGVTFDNLPEILRSEDGPPPLRAFQPLLKASSLTAVLDLGKTIDLDVRVKTGTAGQAVECEKSLGVLVGLIQNEVVGETLKPIELEAAKNPVFKDLTAVLKTVGAAAKDAKFTTLGNETRVTASIPTDLPFTGAYLAAKQKAEEAAAASQSANNLKQIGIAMHGYNDNTGSLPPAAVCDKTGKPLLSWRVLILPYVDEEELFKQFKLDEPWDSEHNKKLLARMPKVYAIPGKTKPDDTDTYYRVFVGNGAGFDWVRGMRLPADFPDGTSNTLLCLTAQTAVPWTKPDELEFDPEKDMTRLFGAVVNGKVQIALFDGSVRTYSKLPSKTTVHAMITRNGGEVLGPDFSP